MTPDEELEATQERVFREYQAEEAEACPACSGLGSWEYWGRKEKCSSCNGKGIILMENEDDGYPD